MNSRDRETLSLLKDVLGDYKHSYADNYVFHCPWCNHRKKKLSINIKNHKWNCWICDDRKGRSLFSLLRQYGANEIYFDRLRKLVHGSENDYLIREYKGDLSSYIKQKLGDESYNPYEHTSPIKLPSEYKPLWYKRKSGEWRKCMKYLIKDRGLTLEDIKKHRLGYCERGDFSRMVIIPNYDQYGNLNFFTGRSYDSDNYLKFRNPKGVSKSNIIGFEFHVNWEEPIILVEGAFDAMTIKRQAVVAFGSEVHKKLKNKILENKTKSIYFGFDPDAVEKSLKAIDYFISFGIDVYFIQFPNGQDPNSLGYKKSWEYIRNAEKMTFSKLRKYVILNKLGYGES